MFVLPRPHLPFRRISLESNGLNKTSKYSIYPGPIPNVPVKPPSSFLVFFFLFFCFGCSTHKTVDEARDKRVNGMTLISMVNSDRLAEIGITRMKRTQLLWNLEVSSAGIGGVVVAAALGAKNSGMGNAIEIMKRFSVIFDCPFFAVWGTAVRGIMNAWWDRQSVAISLYFFRVSFISISLWCTCAVLRPGYSATTHISVVAIPHCLAFWWKYSKLSGVLSLALLSCFLQCLNKKLKNGTQRRISKGDRKAGTAVDPRVFLGVAERLADLSQNRRAYSDNANASTARPMPLPRTARRGSATFRGGGVPTDGSGGSPEGGGEGAGGGELLDLISMDMGRGAKASDGEAETPLAKGKR